MGKDEMTIHNRTVRAKNEMTVAEMQQKGNVLQKKIACIFDANGDGVYDAKEARLFNATTASEDKYGNITLWTNFKSGKKDSNKVSKQNLDITRLYLGYDYKGNEVVCIETINKNNYGSLEREPDGKYELVLGENDIPNGYYIVKGNITKYYTEKGQLTGSTELKNGREYYKDSKGKILYSIERHSGMEHFDDEDFYDSKGVLRYSTHYKGDVKLNLTKYNEKAKKVKTYMDTFRYEETYYDPHDCFKPLDEVIESSYCMPEDE